MRRSLSSLLLASSLLFLVLFSSCFAIPDEYNGTYTEKLVVMQCATNKRVAHGNAFLQVMNGCVRALLDEWIPNAGSFYNQDLSHRLATLSQYVLDEWFKAERYLQVLLVLLCAVPYILSLYDDQFTREGASRLAFYFLHILSLMLRISIALIISVYLPLIFHQESPCVCSQKVQFFNRATANPHTWVLEQEYESYPLPIPQHGANYPWAMPSNQVLIGTLVFLHLTERWSILIGITGGFIVIPVAAVFSGYFSIGQVLPSIVAAVVLHIYLSKTPLFLRIVDFIIHSVAGVVLMIVFKNLNKTASFEYVFATLLDGILWSLFTFFIFASVFTGGFLRLIILRKFGLGTIKAIDFQFLGYMEIVPDRHDLVDAVKKNDDYGDHDSLLPKGHDGSVGSVNSHEYIFTRWYNARKLFIVVVFLFFTILCVNHTARQFADQVLTFFQ